jgi:hypothetical protein
VLLGSTNPNETRILFLCAFRRDLIISIDHEPFELAGWAHHKS